MSDLNNLQWPTCFRACYFAVTNPTGPDSGTNRIYRGGSFCNDAQPCRITNGGRTTLRARSVNAGFKLVME